MKLKTFMREAAHFMFALLFTVAFIAFLNVLFAWIDGWAS